MKTNAERFDVVRWEAGGAAYDRLSGTTHLLDGLAMALVECGLSDPAAALTWLHTHYDTAEDDLPLQQIEDGIENLKAAGLL